MIPVLALAGLAGDQFWRLPLTRPTPWLRRRWARFRRPSAESPMSAGARSTCVDLWSTACLTWLSAPRRCRSASSCFATQTFVNSESSPVMLDSFPGTKSGGACRDTLRSPCTLRSALGMVRSGADRELCTAKPGNRRRLTLLAPGTGDAPLSRRGSRPASICRIASFAFRICSMNSSISIEPSPLTSKTLKSSLIFSASTRMCFFSKTARSSSLVTEPSELRSISLKRSR